MSRPLVSVIIPTYNQAQFIGACLDSLAAQTWPAWEAVVIDNHSTDDTADIVARRRDQRVRYILFRNNGSIAASRNQGINASAGEYIAFLDSDDLWSSRKLEMQCSALAAAVPPSMVGTNGFWLSHPSGSRRRVLWAFRDRDVTFRDAALRNPFVTSGVMLRRSVVEAAGPLNEDLALAGCEDIDYWLRVLHACGPGRLIAAPLVDIRVHDASSSGSLHRTTRVHGEKVVQVLERFRASEPRLIVRAQRNVRMLYARLALRRGEIGLNALLGSPDFTLAQKFLIIAGNIVSRLVALPASVRPILPF